MTIREALAWGIAELKAANKETATLDASVLLAHVLNTNRTSLLAMGTEEIDEKSYMEFQSFIKRRKNGECTAYIIEKKEFFGLEFFVNSSVLVPRPDTEILVEAALEYLAEKNKPSLLDLCTGSGAVAIAVKHKIPQAEVCASDISKEALEAAKKNARKLLSDNANITFLKSDLFKAVPNQNFSIIVSNPPYIPTGEINTLSAEVQNEPRLALDGGETGLSIIQRIIEEAPQYLQRGGSLLLEADPRQMTEIANLLEKKGFKEVRLYKDLAGLNRVIGGVSE